MLSCAETWPSPVPLGTLLFGVPSLDFSHSLSNTGDRQELAVPSGGYSLGLDQDPRGL